MLDPGTLIVGRYVIQSPLASGGNGLVYSATDRTTEKRVAIKILGPHVLHERAAREKLRLEAIVAGRVESENVVQVSDAGVDPASGYPFLVMELLKGKDLQHWVDESGPLDAEATLELLRQVASGLDKSHSWRDSEQRIVPIVHRDLKPENLFLTHREDGTPLVKILDFGLAKVLSGSATLSSEVRGTPLYMAPEQLSQHPVTPATDIWALGLIAFFLLTGKCYWRSGQNANAVMPAVIKEVSDGPPVSPQARLVEFGSPQQLPESFNEWFLCCVNLDPARRYQSAGEAVKALGRALNVPLRSSPFNSNGAISVPRNDSGALPSGTISATRSSFPAVVAQAPTRRRRLFWLAAFAALGIALLFLARTRVAAKSSVPTPTPDSRSANAETASVAAPLPSPRTAPEVISEPTPAASAGTPVDLRPSERPKATTAPLAGHSTRALPSAVRSGANQTSPTRRHGSSPLTAPEPEVPTNPRLSNDPADHR